MLKRGDKIEINSPGSCWHGCRGTLAEDPGKAPGGVAMVNDGVALVRYVWVLMAPPGMSSIPGLHELPQMFKLSELIPDGEED